MKKIVVGIAAISLAAFSGLSVADQSEDDIAEGRAMIQAERDDIIRTELMLSEDEAAAFWPIYRTYQEETSEIMDRYAAMITDYMRRYDAGDFSEEYANELLEEFFQIKQERLDVQTKYLPQFKGALSALKVAQFFQLENKINAEIDIQLAVAVPLIDPS